MNNQNISQLYSRLTELVDAGDEVVVRKFLAEHIKEFPLDVQKKIAFEFFADALDTTVEREEKSSQIKSDGVEAIKNIEKLESNLKDSQRLDSVKKSLGL